tara:strand:- start:173 stop:361 length:189 start_codon:yes stop_codon:yes gene_type:complete
MITETPMTATILWVVEDIQELRPSWTSEQCDEWLSNNSKHIIDRSIEHGWEVIQSLLWDTEN